MKTPKQPEEWAVKPNQFSIYPFSVVDENDNEVAACCNEDDARRICDLHNEEQPKLF